MCGCRLTRGGDRYGYADSGKIAALFLLLRVRVSRRNIRRVSRGNNLEKKEWREEIAGSWFFFGGGVNWFF